MAGGQDLTPYRSAPLVLARPQWANPWARFIVRVKRHFFWTLAAQRHSWRGNCRYLEQLAAQPTGEAKVTIHADNGSVVKNVYVNHGQPRWEDALELDIYRRNGHSRMPRA